MGWSRLGVHGILSALVAAATGNFVAIGRMGRGPRPTGSGVPRARGLDLAMTGWIAVLLGRLVRLRLRRPSWAARAA